MPIIFQFPENIKEHARVVVSKLKKKESMQLYQYFGKIFMFLITSLNLKILFLISGHVRHANPYESSLICICYISLCRKILNCLKCFQR